MKEVFKMEYSAGLTSKLFWMQEARKTAYYMLKGYDKTAIRAIAWEKNIYQVKAEYRAYEVLNGTYRRLSMLPKEVLTTIVNCDIETAKIINLISILLDSRLFYEFMHEVFCEKIHLGEKELTDRDLNVFFDYKSAQSEVVAGWTEMAIKKLKQCFTKMLFEAGLLDSSSKPRIIKQAHINYKLEELLRRNNLQAYLNVIKGV